MEFANKEDQSLNLNLTLDNWVKLKVFKEWQKDILLTLGFKTIPKYNFFELLIFAIKNLETEPIADNEEPEQSKLLQIEEIKTQILIILVNFCFTRALIRFKSDRPGRTWLIRNININHKS